MEFIKDMFTYIIIFAIIILIRIYVLSTAEVVGPSMEPNLTDGDILLMEKISPRFVDYKRFDIIVFKYSSPTYLIKRIIGLPGDKIEYIENKLYINDKYVKEPFNINGRTNNYTIKDLGYDAIPNDKYFVLGDNRNESFDSRYKEVGLIDKKDIMGIPFFQIWPFKDIKIVK